MNRVRRFKDKLERTGFTILETTQFTKGKRVLSMWIITCNPTGNTITGIVETDEDSPDSFEIYLNEPTGEISATIREIRYKTTLFENDD